MNRGEIRKPSGHAALAIAALFGALVAQPALALEAMRPFLSQTADEIQKVLADQEPHKVAVGSFAGPPPWGSSAGPGITQELSEALRAEGLEIDQNSRYTVSGEFSPIHRDEDDPDASDPGPIVGVRVNWTLKRAGKEIRRGSLGIDHTSMTSIELQKLVDGLFPPPVPPQAVGVVEVPGHIREDDDNGSESEPPPPLPNDTVLDDETDTYYTKDRRYGIQILSQDSESLPPVPLWAENPAVLADVRGLNSVAIKIINDTDADLAAQLSLDGISIFAFGKDQSSQYQYHLVPAKSTLVLKGWHNSNQKADKFLLAAYGKSDEALMLKNSSADSLGLISVYLMECSAEGPFRSEGSRELDNRRIVRDETVQVDVNLAEVKRWLNPQGEYLHVRYSRVQTGDDSQPRPRRDTANAAKPDPTTPETAKDTNADAKPVPTTLETAKDADAKADPANNTNAEPALESSGAAKDANTEPAPTPGAASPDPTSPETTKAADTDAEPATNTDAQPAPESSGAARPGEADSPGTELDQHESQLVTSPALFAGEVARGDKPQNPGPARPDQREAAENPPTSETGAVRSVTGTVQEVTGDIVTLGVKTSIGTINQAFRARPGITGHQELIQPGQTIRIAYHFDRKVIVDVARSTDARALHNKSSRFDEVSKPRQNVWLILIGAQNYENLSKLESPARDVDYIHDIFQRHGGVEPERILRISDEAALKPNKATLDRAIPEFLAKVGPNDTVVMFYAGHGLRGGPSKEEEEKVYLAPTDCDPRNLSGTAWPIDGLLDRLGASRAQYKVLLLDACHSGAINGGQLMKVLNRTRGVTCLVSCEHEQVSREIEALGHGAFTIWLGKALSVRADVDHDGVISFTELFDSVIKISGTPAQQGQNPAQFFPPNVRGNPSVMYLSGPAARLARAQALAGSDRGAAVELLMELGELDDVELDLLRLKLLEESLPEARSVYLKMARTALEEFERVNPKANEWDRRRLVRAWLLLASSEMDGGNRDLFIEAIRNAKRQVDFLPSLADQVLLGVAIAETRYRESTALRDKKHRDAMEKDVHEQLTQLADAIASDGNLDLKIELAAAAWRVGLDDLWDAQLESIKTSAWTLVPQAPSLEWFKAQCLSYAKARDPNGASKCAQEVDKIAVFERFALTEKIDIGRQQPKAAQAYAAVALAAAREGEDREALLAIDRVDELLEQAADLGSLDYWRALRDLSFAYSALGDVEQANATAKRLPQSSLPYFEALAEIARASAALNQLEETRVLLASLATQAIPERGEARRAYAQAFTITNQDRLRELIDWINAKSTDTIDRACGYIGVADGISRKPWVLAAIHGPGRPNLLLEDAGIRPATYGASPNLPTAPPLVAARPVVNAPNLNPLDQETQRISNVIDQVNTGLSVYNTVRQFADGNYQGGVGAMFGIPVPGGFNPGGFNPGGISPGGWAPPTPPDPRRFLRNLPGGSYIPF